MHVGSNPTDHSTHDADERPRVITELRAAGYSFVTVDALVAALDAGSDDGFPAGARAKLEAAREYLSVAPAVSRVVTDLPLPAFDDAVRAAPADPARLVELSAPWGLGSPLAPFLAACSR